MALPDLMLCLCHALGWAFVLVHPIAWWLVYCEHRYDYGATPADILMLRGEVAVLEQTLNEMRSCDA